MMINEKSPAFVTARPTDRNGVVFLPTTARYRMDALKTKTSFVAWTTLTAAKEMLITIPSASNTIENTSNARERKVVTVETDAGTSTAQTEEYQYWVKNLNFIS